MKRYHIEADVRLNPKQLSAVIDLLSESSERLEVTVSDEKGAAKSNGTASSGIKRPRRYPTNSMIRLKKKPPENLGICYEVWVALENAHGKKAFKKGEQKSMLEKGGFLSSSSNLTKLLDEGYVEVVKP